MAVKRETPPLPRAVFANPTGFVQSEHKQPTQSTTTGGNLLGCSENVGGINTDGIDGTLMTSQLSNWHKSIHVPEFQNTASAAAE